jgi:ubiquinone/menaquinone biosynthesis C-methylase UbiE
MIPVRPQLASSADFTTVTELSGDMVSRAQVASAYHRYHWAACYCEGRDVLELACGSGVGLGLLANTARSVQAGDITPSLVSRARDHYRKRYAIGVMDAQAVSLPSSSIDVIVLFEAIYYLPRPDAFLAECRRILRPGGRLLLTTANKDVGDFNPSPYAQANYGVLELGDLLRRGGFSFDVFGYWSQTRDGLLHRALKPAKRALVSAGFMPKTMQGKKFLKRFVFGKLVAMPSELIVGQAAYDSPTVLSAQSADQTFRVIYCAATLAN